MSMSPIRLIAYSPYTFSRFFSGATGKHPDVRFSVGATGKHPDEVSVFAIFTVFTLLEECGRSLFSLCCNRSLTDYTYDSSTNQYCKSAETVVSFHIIPKQSSVNCSVVSITSTVCKDRYSTNFVEKKHEKELLTNLTVSPRRRNPMEFEG